MDGVVVLVGLAPAAPAVLSLGSRRQQWISRPLTQGCLGVAEKSTDNTAVDFSALDTEVLGSGREIHKQSGT